MCFYAVSAIWVKKKNPEKKQSVPCLSILALNTQWLRGLERTIQTIPLLSSNTPESMSQTHFAHFNLNFSLEINFPLDQKLSIISHQHSHSSKFSSTKDKWFLIFIKDYMLSEHNSVQHVIKIQHKPYILVWMELWFCWT